MQVAQKRNAARTEKFYFRKNLSTGKSTFDSMKNMKSNADGSIVYVFVRLVVYGIPRVYLF